MVDNAITVGRFLSLTATLHISLPLFMLLTATDFALTTPQFISLIFQFGLAYFIHEFAHISARYALNIKVFGILAYPFGGWWLTDGQEESKEIVEDVHNEVEKKETGLRFATPGQQACFYLAGPCANILIALYLWITLLHFSLPQFQLTTVKEQMFWTHLWLALINFLPAPPSDLGFLLYYNYPTRRALFVRFSQIAIVIVVILAIWQHTFSVVLAGGVLFLHSLRVVVYDHARERAKSLKMSHFLRPTAQLDYFDGSVPIRNTADVLHTSLQDSFPVLERGKVIGMVERQAILASIGQGDGYHVISTISTDAVRTFDLNDSLGALFEELLPFDEVVCLVESNGEFVGIVQPGRIANTLWIQYIEEQHHEELL
jgi:Zn-dependent protease